jgi:hypothetical protein
VHAAVVLQTGMHLRDTACSGHETNERHARAPIQWGAGSTAYGLSLSKQVMAGVHAGSLAELRRVPPANISAWPDATYYGSQLFSGFFLDETVMPVPSLQRLIDGQLNVQVLSTAITAFLAARWTRSRLHVSTALVERIEG